MTRTIALVCALSIVALASADIYYDTGGFEAYAYGPVNGQGVTPNVPLGWHDVSTPAANMAVVSGTPGGGGRSLRFQVPNTQGEVSSAEVVFAQDLRAIAGTVAVDFTVYRQSDRWNSNFWFWPNGTNPSYGLQWDGGNGVSQTLPLGFSGAGVPTIMDMFVPIRLEYDFTGTDPVARGYYNGNLVTTLTYNDPNAPFSQFLGWTFSLGHDDGIEGSDTETLWVDNFSVAYTPIPEPAGILLLVAGLLLRRR